MMRSLQTIPTTSETSRLILPEEETTTHDDATDGPASRRLQNLFERPSSTAQIRPYESIREQDEDSSVLNNDNEYDNIKRKSNKTSRISAIQNTAIGSVTFLLYHVVFCLAQAATIIRPHATHSSTGLLAQTAALGIVFAGPVFVQQLGDQIPAIYPASDLFLAPFLAHVAATIDETLHQHNLADNDRIFLATFSAVTGAGLLLSGCLCVVAARVKLANLGAFLPYSVLCGFFTAIGILMWTLGFSVDTGYKVGEVVRSGDIHVMLHALVHHAPSVVIGVVMHVLGPKNPFWVMILVGWTVGGVYLIMWLTGTTLQQAQEWNWFFPASDLVVSRDYSGSGYGPPLPFGVLMSLVRGEVFWEAFRASVPTVLALAFLYVIRCSLHSAALKKNIPNVTRKRPDVPPLLPNTNTKKKKSTIAPVATTFRQPPLTLGYILEHGYGYSQLVAAVTGGITVAPSVAASLTLFKLGAEAKSPQYGSCVLVLLFYLTDFQFVQYIPKAAFSCLLVLAGLDMIKTWLIGSFLKTKAKLEWMVAPLLVVCAFIFGMLPAIFMGVAVSTFIFVANFYRVGSVKFVGSGLTLRSTVERGVLESKWLDQNADLIQILALQNYLFFGNSQSANAYITTMFEEPVLSPQPGPLEYPIPPIPKYLIVDFTLVSGMDTSAIDTFREIADMCRDRDCRLYLAGLTSNLKSMMLYAGLKPEPMRRFSYTPDLESALAKAEDSLVTTVFHLEEKVEMETSVRKRQRNVSNVEDGFLYALQKIDIQHGLHTADDLFGLDKYTIPVELHAGDVLDRQDGLYFVETGLMRVQHSSNYTTIGLYAAPAIPFANPTITLGHLNARTGSMGREMSLRKEQNEREDQKEQSFRLARFGAGWIIGSIEASAGLRKPGEHIAISDVRLHHLPYSAIQQAETTNPTLTMHLYKLLSHLSAKRQEMTIRQLGQFVRILNAPTPRLKGGGKSEMAKLQGMHSLM